MRIYLDVCAIQRPLDDLSQLRVRLEAEAVLGVLAACAAGAAALVTSDVHLVETRRNTFPTRRAYATEVDAALVERLEVSDEAIQLARTFGAATITGPDALHLATAVLARVDIFCTTDDRLLRRSARVDTGAVAVVTPLQLAALLDTL